MSVITSDQRTAAQNVAAVQAGRQNFAAAEKQTGLPFDDRSGRLKSGAYTVTAADDTAGNCVLATGLTRIDSFHLQVLRSNVLKTVDQVVTVSGGNITVADGSTTAVVAGDVIQWWARGVNARGK